MSKKSRRAARGMGFPWPLAAFGGILLVLSIALFERGSGQSAAGSGLGRISVDQEKIDYGYVQFGTNKTFKIKLTNTGEGALRLTGEPYIEVLEGC